MYKINYSNFNKWENNCCKWIIGAIILTLICGYFSFEAYIKKAFMDGKVVATSVEQEIYPIGKPLSIFYMVYYNVDGKEYEEIVLSDKYYDVSSIQKIVVYYNKADPSDCISQLDVFINKSPLPGIIVAEFILIANIIEMINIIKRKNIASKLSYNGTLIKNLPYERIIYRYRDNRTLRSSRWINGRLWERSGWVFGKGYAFETIKKVNLSPSEILEERIKINYTTPLGEELTLISEPKYKNASFTVFPEVVDLLIDLNDPSKYFIDYSIAEYIEQE